MLRTSPRGGPTFVCRYYHKTHFAATNKVKADIELQLTSAVDVMLDRFEHGQSQSRVALYLKGQS